MCGQAGIHRRRKSRLPRVNELADALLLEIEYRGRDATGYLALHPDGRVQVEKHCIPASKFVDRGHKRIPVNAKTVLLHTRFATVGRKDDPRNAHPVTSGRIAAVHNGTIRNANEIFRAFDLPRKAEVDSEVIPALIDHAGWENAKEAIDLLQGGAAFAAVKTDCPDEVILARTINYPMVYMVTDDLVIWASTEVAIRKAWAAVYGRRPLGTFYHLDPWSMVRINGEVTASRIRKYTAPPVPKRPKMHRRSTPKPKKSKRPVDRPTATRKQNYEVLTTGGTVYQCLAPDASAAAALAASFGWTVKTVTPLGGSHDRTENGTVMTGSKRARKRAKKRAQLAAGAAVSRAVVCDNPFDYLGQADEAQPLTALHAAVEDLVDEGYTYEDAWQVLDAEREVIEDELDFWSEA